MNNLEKFCKKHIIRVKKRIRYKKNYVSKKLKKNYYLDKFCKKHITKINNRNKLNEKRRKEYHQIIKCSLCGCCVSKGILKKKKEDIKEFEKKCFVCRLRPKKQVLYFTQN